MNKSEIAGLTYREKEVGDKIYVTKRVASSDEKTSINNILNTFLQLVRTSH